MARLPRALITVSMEFDIDRVRYHAIMGAMNAKSSACCAPGAPTDTTVEVTDLAARLKALADPTRLAILLMLRDRGGSLCACEIEAAFDLSQPTISHHLRRLRTAGLVEAERRGSWMHFRVTDGALTAIGDFARSFDAAVTPTTGST